MNIFHRIFLLLAACCCMAAPSAAQTADFHTVPLPREVRALGGTPFTLTAKTLIVYPSGDKVLRRHATELAGFIEQATGLKLTVSDIPAQRQCIRLLTSNRLPDAEAYTIRVNSEIVMLEGGGAAGLYHAVQTLRKSLPQGTAARVMLPATEVNDVPRFTWRGAHLDVARHFVTPDSVKRYIDLLALHGMNRFHWHLTDDQGWRVELKKYPLLTKVGSMRDRTVIGNNTGQYDNVPYGGFYTQREIRDIVRYADERHITIVPEIDLPGHMQAALAAYPELGCTGGPYKVWDMWGVSPDVLCAGNPKVYDFIDGILDELVKLFPTSDYIHIGGDECPKTRWEACPKCQAMIKAHHLEAADGHTAEQRLQSYVIRHAVAHLEKLGRKAIGWDEILEGGLAPGVAVMSWTGVGGGIEAARQGHNVVMTPARYLYFDYRQSDGPDGGFEGSGGYLPIEQVYAYEPVPHELTSAEQKHILGVQANLWSEHLANFRQAEYMALPRMAALSELQWTELHQKNFDNFMQRLPRLIDLYRREGYNYCRTVYNVKADLSTDTVRHAVMARLSTLDNAPIYYTLDGSAPTTASARYEGPIAITRPATLRASALRGTGNECEVSREIHFNLATARPIRLLQPSHRSYTYAGAGLLTDGLVAATTNYSTGEWLGFCGTDLEAVIDLGSEQTVSSVALQTCVEKGSWVFDARAFTVSGSTDGKTFTQLATESYPVMQPTDPNRIYPHRLTFTPAKVRYVKVLVRSEHEIPSWHPGAGNPGFLFVDEIEVK